MGSNDGAETCEIVGLFLLHSSGEKFNKDDVVYTEMMDQLVLKIIMVIRTWTLHLTLTQDYTGHIENKTMTQDI